MSTKSNLFGIDENEVLDNDAVPAAEVGGTAAAAAAAAYPPDHSDIPFDKAACNGNGSLRSTGTR